MGYTLNDVKWRTYTLKRFEKRWPYSYQGWRRCFVEMGHNPDEIDRVDILMDYRKWDGNRDPVQEICPHGEIDVESENARLGLLLAEGKYGR